MIPEKVNVLFQFIDFLHKNKKDYIETYLPLIDELIELGSKRSELKPRQNYKDKQKYEESQKIITEKFSIIKDRVTIPMLSELAKLNIWSGDDVYASIYNNNAGSVCELKENFTDSDIIEIRDYKQKYLSFRTETNTDFLSLSDMFSNLDEVLELLFDYFKDTQANEFEAFEQVVIQVSSIEEASKILNKSAWNKNEIAIKIDNNEAFVLQPTETKKEQKIENHLSQKSISFTDSEIIDLLFNLLKDFFPERGNDLKNALLGKELQTRLLFPHNQNKFVEVFRRAKYNGKILSSSTEIKDWLCTNFEYRYKLGSVEQIKPFNSSTVWDILTKGKSVPPAKERICVVDWLAFKSKVQLDNEAQNENLLKYHTPRIPHMLMGIDRG